jgi:hypothetical protein
MHRASAAAYRDLVKQPEHTMSTWDFKEAKKPAERSLRKDLAFAAAAFARRRHDLVRGDMAMRLHAQGWIEWHEGHLRLSREGAAICDGYLASHW